MSRDPFEEMQKRNPVTRDELPMAPMSVAERILGHRTRAAMPGWALAVAAMFVVAAVGGSMLLWLGGGDSLPVGSGGTTTTPGSTTSGVVTTVATTSGFVTTVAVPESGEGTLYFFVDDAGEGWSGGPFLIPVSVRIDGRSTNTGSALLLEEASLTMRALLEGEASLSIPALSTAIPAGTELLGIEIEAQTGVIRVNLSTEFAAGGGSASMIGRVGQVVYTLTAIDGVNGVRFLVDGVPTTVLGGEGFIVDDPATETGFDDLLPAVMIDSPVYGAASGSPLIATGTANVFEATVSIELLDDSGAVLFEGFSTATCGTGCRGEWSIEIPYAVGSSQSGTLRAFESSAEDGRPINVREHKVLLYASELPGETCSGYSFETPFVEQEGLPEAVAAKRAAIWDAAVECDWGQLQRLLGSPFSWTFGGGDDSIDAPIHHWQGLEEDGQDPIRFLAELLNRPFGTITNQDITYYVWPSAHTKPWEDVTAAERESLRPLFDDADFADFEAFGAYYHYRIGILANGDWVYFIAGD
ncbi:MAG: Gmad2 immunoglobulin-like domain-containing protein [Acidimicrobiia bacterium]